LNPSDPGERVDTTELVETPERVRFRYRVAGPGQRSVAWLIDTLIQGIAAVLVVGVTSVVSPVLGGLSTGVMMLGLFALQWFYGLFFELVLAGRTPGKLALELRVVRTDGSAARFPELLLRNLVRAADFLPVGFAVGVLVMAFDSRLRRLGDLVAGTVVIAEDRTRMLAGVRIDPPVTEEERRGLPARVHLSPEELEVIEAFLARRPQLGRERAEDLARHFGPVLTVREGVVAPTWDRVLALAYARATGRDREPA
jgi:uncharacterized RDD family membrane protein YckC